MNAPTEVDGWRIVPDPETPGRYWRMRAFELEYNYWNGAVWRGDWATTHEAHQREVDGFRHDHPDVVEDLLCNP